MRLSEAIRRGCEGTPQVSGLFGYGDGRLGCCVQGAAILGKNGFIPDYKTVWDMLSRTWPWAERESHHCPEVGCGFKGTLIGIMLPHLNNYPSYGHGWTRERIADWVESLETSQEQARLTSPESREGALKVAREGADSEVSTAISGLAA